MVKPENIDNSWKFLLKEEFDKDYFKILIDRINNERKTALVFPNEHDTFKVFNMSLENIKVFIIAQDPYTDYKEIDNKIIPTATGIAFESVKIPKSLRNIFKEIKNEYTEYKIPITGNLTEWVNQGVFLLNSILTVESGNSLSHQRFGWETFTDKVIQIISENRENVVFILWGNFAKSKKRFINQSKHLILESSHPSPLSVNGFFGNNHFKLCNEYLEKNTLTKINW